MFIPPAPVERGISITIAGIKTPLRWQADLPDANTAGVFMKDPKNLNGTYDALDCYSTPMECNREYEMKMRQGLLSASGWTVLDDSTTARLVPAPNKPGGLPVWWTKSKLGKVDVYIHAYPNLDYKAAIGRWMSVLGRPAMLPRSAFGVWWSRYWRYSQQSLVEEVLEGYKNNSIPLNNLVMDMDWHNEPADKTCQSWGNWDVNTTLFPDMRHFAEELHAHGSVIGNPLKISLNVHPQSGMDHCESRYSVFAKANGIDPRTNATVECDVGNETFFDSLTSIYMDSDPLHLVDVWWTDYSGCGESGGNPQLWNNLAFHQHMTHGRHVRGQAFSRYGGVGASSVFLL